MLYKYYLLVLIAISFIIPQAFGATAEPLYIESEHPTLVIHKIVSDGPPSVFGFDISSDEGIIPVEMTTVQGFAESSEITLTAGVEYTVSETRSPPSFSESVSDCTIDGDSVTTTFIPEDGDTVDCTFDSVYTQPAPVSGDEPPTLVIAVDTAGPAGTFSFDVLSEESPILVDVSFDGTSTAIAEITLTAGIEYAIEITSPPPGYVFVYVECYVGFDTATLPFTPADGDVVECIFDFEYTPPAPTLAIHVGTFGPAGTFSFDVLSEESPIQLDLSFDGKTISSAEIILTAGIAYTIEITDTPPDYTLAFEVDCYDGGGTEFFLPFILADGDDLLCFYEFEYIPPAPILIINVTTFGPAGTFSFDVLSEESPIQLDLSFDGTSTAIAEITLTAGIEYTIEITDTPPGYDFLYVDCFGDGEEFFLPYTPEDEDVLTCFFEFEYIPPAPILTIGVEAFGPSWTFSFEILSEGVITPFDLSGGDAFTSEEIILTAGVEYTVSALEHADFTLLFENCYGSDGDSTTFTPQDGDVIHCVFGFDPIPPAPTLVITVDTGGSPGTFSFEITSEKPSIPVDVSYDVVTATSEEITLTAGIEYAIEVTSSPGYTFSYVDCYDGGGTEFFLPFTPTDGDEIICSYYFDYILSAPILVISLESLGGASTTFSFELSSSIESPIQLDLSYYESVGIDRSEQITLTAGIEYTIDIISTTQPDYDFLYVDCYYDSGDVTSTTFTPVDGDFIECIFTIEHSPQSDYPLTLFVDSYPLYIPVGEPYVDLGISCTDTSGDDITDSIVIAGDTVDTDIVGTYRVIYVCTDAITGSADSASRTVIVIETPEPEETFTPSTDIGQVTIITDAGGFAYIEGIDEDTFPTDGKPSEPFLHGLFSWTIIDLELGETITLTITLPEDTPKGTEYWKIIDDEWIDVTTLLGSDDGDDIITLRLTDGGLGDADRIRNGVIVDPGGPIVVDTTAEAAPEETVKKRSGGGCADCTPPTLGLDKNYKRIVDYGFAYNGNAVQVEKWHTPYPLINATVGEMNLVEIKVYENNGIHNIKYVQFGLGGEGIGIPLNDFEVLIKVDLAINGTFRDIVVDEIVIDDKDNLIDNTTVTADVYTVGCQDLSITPNCLKVDLQYSYREETFNHIMVVNAVDKPRNSQNFYLNEGVKVVGESLNPPPTYSMYNKKSAQQTENLYLTLTRTDKINYIWADQFDVQYLQISDNRFDRLTPQEKYSCTSDNLVIKSVTKRNNVCQFMLLINYEIERAEHTMNGILSSYNYDIIEEWNHNNKALKQYEPSQ